MILHGFRMILHCAFNDFIWFSCDLVLFFMNLHCSSMIYGVFTWFRVVSIGFDMFVLDVVLIDFIVNMM